jgi:Zn-dependent membrane protease YugP
MNRVKQTTGQTLAGVAMVLVVAALLFVVIGLVANTPAAAVFGGVLLGLAVLIGVVGVGMNAFQR